jgi:hypothetical protein
MSETLASSRIRRVRLRSRRDSADPDRDRGAREILAVARPQTIVDDR